MTPTVAPLSGRPMDLRRAFDLIATLIRTWEPYNELLTSDVPKLALDDRATAVMQDWIDSLQRVQAEWAAEPDDPGPSTPAAWNVSIST